MKKFISLIISFIYMMSILLLIIILNVNIITKYKNIEKLANKINYIDLVDLEYKNNDIKDKYDSIYKELQNSGLTSVEIGEFYNTDFFENTTTNIIYKEANYLVSLKEENINLEEVTKILNKSINSMKMNENRKKILKSTMSNNITKIIEIDNVIRYNINTNISYGNIEILRFIFSNYMKIILLSIIIISILLQYFINKEKFMPYIFIPTIICSIIIIVLSLFMNYIFNSFINNKLILSITSGFISTICSNTIFISIILLIISIIYLMINEKVLSSSNNIKPKLKKKNF